MLDTFREATPKALGAIRIEMAVRKTNEVHLFFPMGGQTDHLLFQKIAREGVFCLVADPAKVKAKDVLALGPKSMILSGGPVSVAVNPPPFDEEIFSLGIPTLGVCLGFQMWAKYLGLRVESGRRQYSEYSFDVTSKHVIFDDCPDEMPVLQSHGDEVFESEKVQVLGFCDGVLAAAACANFVGFQFHPELPETKFGEKMISNFLFKFAGAKDRFPVEDVAATKVEEMRKLIRGKTLLIALSGGSDSSVVAYIAKRAKSEGTRIVGIYIKGVDRADDEAYVHKHFGDKDWIELEVVDATEEFLEIFDPKLPTTPWEKLLWWWNGTIVPTTMKEKRIAMRVVYPRVLNRMIAKYNADFIAQGTLFTDISESGGGLDSGAEKAQIKLHHNVNLPFDCPEIIPLKDCVKDGARDIGRTLGCPEELMTRHPYPGPGRVVRIEGPITRKLLAIEDKADEIWIEELRKAGQYEKTWQAGATVTKSEHSITGGDAAGMGYLICIWAVWSVNGFTAQPAQLPWDVILTASLRINNEIPESGAVSYRTSPKPKTTIEWG